MTIFVVNDVILDFSILCYELTKIKRSFLWLFDMDTGLL